MKAAKIGLLVLMVLSLVSIACYGQTAQEYYDTGLDFLAKKMYDKAIEIDPGYVEARYALAIVYIKMREYEQAELQLEEVLKIAPDFEAARTALAELKDIRR